MVRGRQYKKFWLKGSIIEPVVAVVILVMSIGMAFTILTRLNIVPSLQAKNKANEILSEETKNIWEEKELIDKEETFGGLTLYKTIIQEGKDGLIIIVLEIKDLKDKLIAEKTIMVTERQLFGFKD